MFTTKLAPLIGVTLIAAAALAASPAHADPVTQPGPTATPVAAVQTAGSSDLVLTPGGPAPAACVHEVPDGAVVTLVDGVSVVTLNGVEIARYAPCPDAGSVTPSIASAPASSVAATTPPDWGVAYIPPAPAAPSPAPTDSLGTSQVTTSSVSIVWVDDRPKGPCLAAVPPVAPGEVDRGPMIVFYAPCA